MICPGMIYFTFQFCLLSKMHFSCLRPIALLDSSKSINIKFISTAATVYLMSTALQNCKINCLYSVLPGKLEVIMLITLINWFKSYVLFHCHSIDHSNKNNRQRCLSFSTKISVSLYQKGWQFSCYLITDIYLY